MNNAEKKFRKYAVLVIFILLTVLLSVINVINFTMAGQDADKITERIAEQQGRLEPETAGAPLAPGEKDFRMGPMGPDSPELGASIRYFTVAFDKDGKAQTVVFRLSAVTEEEAAEWAGSLRKETTGWTRGTYRYRVWQSGKQTCVTVIDQGRELLSCYRILLISAIGEAVSLIAAWFVLRAIGRKIYSPLEEADRKQKVFIQNANREFRLPLTVINGNTELIERAYGPGEETRSTRRQLEKLSELLRKLDSIGLYEDGHEGKAEVSLSEVLREALDKEAGSFAAKGLALNRSIQENVALQADRDAMERMAAELVGNALKYAQSEVSFSLTSEKGRILLEAKNDADLPDGPADQVFDRFTTLANAAGGENVGLGLALVRDIVKAHKGRVTAAVDGGIFTVRIAL